MLRIYLTADFKDIPVVTIASISFSPTVVAEVGVAPPTTNLHSVQYNDAIQAPSQCILMTEENSYHIYVT